MTAKLPEGHFLFTSGALNHNLLHWEMPTFGREAGHGLIHKAVFRMCRFILAFWSGISADARHLIFAST